MTNSIFPSGITVNKRITTIGAHMCQLCRYRSGQGLQCTSGGLYMMTLTLETHKGKGKTYIFRGLGVLLSAPLRMWWLFTLKALLGICVPHTALHSQLKILQVLLYC